MDDARKLAILQKIRESAGALFSSGRSTGVMLARNNAWAVICAYAQGLGVTDEEIGGDFRNKYVNRWKTSFRVSSPA